MNTLHELTDEFLAILDLAEEEDDDEALLGSWEAVSLEYDDKIEAYCKVIAQIEADEKALDEEQDRIEKKRGRLKKRAKWMRERVMESLRAVGKRKAGGNLYSASIRVNGGVLPLVVECEATKLPDEFKRVKYEADNAAIREALDAGRTLDFAHFGERGESLKIN